MDNRTPKKAVFYIIILTCFAASIVTYSITIMDWNRVNWFPIFVFLILIVLSDSFPVTLPRGGNVTVGLATIAASILLFQPLIVIAITVARDSFLLFKGNNHLKNLFNVSQLATSTGSAALVYRYFTPVASGLTLGHILAFIISMVVFFLLNTTFVTLILAYIEDEKPHVIWLINMKWATLTYLSMAPLGAIIAVIYINIGFWGLVLFLLPLILARHSFQSYINMRQTFLDTIKSLSLAIDAKDPYTRGHSSRVSDYAVALARELKWPEDKVEFLQYIALIHDVGKVIVPEDILKKEDLLSQDEYNVMKTHSSRGAEVIKDVAFFSEGTDMIKHHHERWDGNGYPDQIRGEEIPEGARILSVVDAFDAMTSKRPYRKVLRPSDALRELESRAGTQFDPKIVDAFIRIFPQLVFDISNCNLEDFPVKNNMIHPESYH